jgi:AcrR family transcriptional regulator
MVVGDASMVELLWNLREPPSRGPKPRLTVRMIARTAVGIADVEGIDGLTMQRVAAELGLTKMALYRYLGGRDELVAVMIEEAVGEPPDLDREPGTWRSRLETYARLLWTTWDRHPWLPTATVGARVMGPNEVGWVESALRALAGTGLTGVDQMNAVQLLSGHIRNSQSGGALGSFPWNPRHRLNPAMADLLRRHQNRYPAVTAAAATDGGGDPRAFGLHRILDGLETLIATRTHRGDRPAPDTRGRTGPT